MVIRQTAAHDHPRQRRRRHESDQRSPDAADSRRSAGTGWSGRPLRCLAAFGMDCINASASSVRPDGFQPARRSRQVLGMYQTINEPMPAMTNIGAPAEGRHHRDLRPSNEIGKPVTTMNTIIDEPSPARLRRHEFGHGRIADNVFGAQAETLTKRQAISRVMSGQTPPPARRCRISGD